jgi:hypothetical protein
MNLTSIISKILLIDQVEFFCSMGYSKSRNKPYWRSEAKESDDS